jgi:hypothetical protein
MLEGYKDRIIKVIMGVYEATAHIHREADVLFGAEPPKGQIASPQSPPHSIQVAVRELEEAVASLHDELNRFKDNTETSPSFPGRGR